MGTDIDSFDKVLLLEENRQLRKEVNKLRSELEGLKGRCEECEGNV